MSTLPLADADAIINAVLDAGKKKGLRPMTAAIVDTGGNLIAFKRGDGSSFFRFELAFGKAYAAMAFSYPTTGKLQTFFESKPAFAEYCKAASHGKMLADAGGVRIFDKDGIPVGAVGVTGDSSLNDEECAIEAIIAAGYKSPV